MRVVKSTAAEADIARILEYHESRNPAYADRLASEFDRAFDQLRDIPLLGVARTRLQPGLRVLIRADHLIFYRVDSEADHLVIVRILHHRQDSDTALKATGPENRGR